jgi:hypothetical protein
MKRVLLPALAFAVFGGCGGKTDDPRPDPRLCRPIVPLTDRPDPGSGPVDCNALDGFELFPIDSFESGVATNGWYVNNDRTALQTPMPNVDPPRSSEIPQGRCVGARPSENAATVCDSPTTPRGECTRALVPDSRSAMRIVTGLLTANGGQFARGLPKDCPILPPEEQCQFQPGPPEIGPCSIDSGPTQIPKGCHATQDFSDWDGIVLWARVAPGSVPTLLVRAADVATDDKGCICDPYTNQNDSSTGCDKFGTRIVMDHTFRAYLVPFKEMQQGGWGLKSQKLDLANLFSIGFEYGRGAWDLWIDDVAFYRRRP